MLKCAPGLIAFLAYSSVGTLAYASSPIFNPTPDSEALAILREAPSHGLRAGDYNIDELTQLNERLVRGESDSRVEYQGLMTDALLRLFRDLRPQLAWNEVDESQVLRSGNLRGFYESLLPRHRQYEALRTALHRQEYLAKRSTPTRIGRGRTLRVGDVGERVHALRARLVKSQHHLQIADDVFDVQLEAAVRAYQTLHGLEADGLVGRRTQRHLDMSAAERAGRIRLALARWRELPSALGDEYVHVNIPEYRLEMIRDGQPQVQMRVVVGSKDDPTPTFSDEIEYLVFNPYWHVPRSIALKELVPKAVDTPGYLTSQNYDVLSDGELVDEASIDWAAIDGSSFGYRIRQQPGPGNALGAVKFLFPNSMNIYLHDSPARGLYERSVRAFSHGCIRLENPAALAEALLEAEGDWSADRIAGTMRGGSRRQINLDLSVPVYLTYITAKVTAAGELAFFDDVYGRDRAQLSGYL